MRWYQHAYHTVSAHKIVFSTIPYIPKLLHPPIAVVTALIFFALLKNERRAAARNLRRICGVSGLRVWWKVYWTFYSFCDFMVSYCFVPQADDRELLEMLPRDGRDRAPVERCLAGNKGLIVWTAHLGNWEFASRLLELHGRRVNVARVVERDNEAELMLRNLMTNPRLNIIQVNDNPQAPIELLSAVRNNEIVAMQGDRAYRSFCGEVPFFGKAVKFPMGAFMLAYISGAPLLPGVVVRRSWLRYRVVFGEPIVLSQCEDRETALRAGLQKAVAFLEENVRTYPDQWLNFYDFWERTA